MRPLLLCLLMALAAGCDASGGDLAAGTFTLRLDGTPAQTRSGAFAGSYVRASTGPTTAVLLGTDPIATALGLSETVVGFVADREALTLGRHNLTAVRPGGDLAEGTVAAFYLDPARYDDSTSLRGFYFATEGRLTIDAIEEGGAVRGTYALDVTEYDAALAPTGEPLHLSGAFHAVPSDAFGDEDALLSRRAGPRLW